MFLPELSKQIQGGCHLTSNNRIIRISAVSNNRESTVSFLKRAIRSVKISDAFKFRTEKNFGCFLISDKTEFFGN